MNYFFIFIFLYVFNFFPYILVTHLYNEQNKKRANELQYCIAKNIENPLIDKVYIFFEGSNKVLDLKNPKLKVIECKKRPYLKEIISFVNNNLTNKLIIISNSDIFFDETLSLLNYEDLNKKFIALTRHNCMTTDWDRHYHSFDSWVFKSPLKFNVEEDVCLGDPTSDILFVDYARDFYKVINPSISVFAWHYDSNLTGNKSYVNTNRTKELFKNLRFKNALLKKPIYFSKITSFFAQKNIPSYGKFCSWPVPKGLLNKNSVCICAYGGENITFEVDILRNFGCEIFCIECIPKCIDHFKLVKLALTTKEKTEQIVKYYPGNQLYNPDINTFSPKNIKLINYGLYQDGSYTFYNSIKCNYLSYSIIKNQKSSTNYCSFDCISIKTLMEKIKRTKIDLLKLSVEGAEIKILKDILKYNLSIKCILVQFDYLKLSSNQEKSKKKIKNILKEFTGQGYNIIRNDKSLYEVIIYKD